MSDTGDWPTILEAWRQRGRFETVFGHRLFVVDEGPRDAPPLLVLHGFPSSSLDYRQTLPHLTESFRVVLHDHLGFGLSDKPGTESYSLFEQAELALGLWRLLGLERGHLLGHDYGTSVVTEILARRERGLAPFEPTSVTLCNGSVHIELASITLTQKLLKSDAFGPLLARLSSARFFKARIRRLLAHPERIPHLETELELMWRLLIADGGREALPLVGRYLDERVKFWNRWIGALSRLDVPAHVVWGRRDPIALPAIAEQLAAEIPGASLHWLDDLGHYPMLEAPEAWAVAVSEAIAQNGGQ